MRSEYQQTSVMGRRKAQGRFLVPDRNLTGPTNRNEVMMPTRSFYLLPSGHISSISQGTRVSALETNLNLQNSDNPVPDRYEPGELVYDNLSTSFAAFEQFEEWVDVEYEAHQQSTSATPRRKRPTVCKNISIWLI